MRLQTCTGCGRPFQPKGRHGGRCPECRPAGRDDRSPTTRAQDAEYAAERDRVLAGNPTCTYCPKPATTVDHVHPVARGGRHRGNLVPCCSGCNSSKGARTAPRPERGAPGQRADPDPVVRGMRLA